MDREISDALENAYTGNPDAIVRISSGTDDGLVWKIDLGRKKQRRLVGGVDNCTRGVRRIFLGADTGDHGKGLAATAEPAGSVSTSIVVENESID